MSDDKWEWEDEDSQRGNQYDRAHLSATHNEDSFVYFIQAGGTDGPIKIGRSTSPSSRLKTLQRTTEAKLTVRRAVRVHKSRAVALEHGLHEHYDYAHIVGEWFKPVPELLAMARIAA